MIRKCFIAGISLLVLAFTRVASADTNLMQNPGAEKVIPAEDYPREIKPYPPIAGHVPEGWGLYNGGGECNGGVTDKDAHTGQYSSFLTFKDFFVNKDTGEKTVNIDLMLGETNGYNGKYAIGAEANTAYYFSFWVKGDISQVSVRVFTWGFEDSRGMVKPSLIGDIVPTSTWTKYEGKFTTKPDTKKFAVGIHINKIPGLTPGQTIYVDDVEIKILPNVTKIDEGNPSPIKVAIYDNGTFKEYGQSYIYEALEKDKGIKAEKIDNLKIETLKKYDVLILSAIHSLSKIDAGNADLGIAGVDWISSLLNFVDSGGGIILGHDCVGYRGIFGTTPIFSNICVGKDKVDWKKEIKVIKNDHPIMQGAPGEFEHSYFDHITIEPGPKATVLAKDKENNPVIVAGEVSRGRIVAIGYPMGLWTKLESRPKNEDYAGSLPEEEKRILINSVRWAGSRPKYNVPQEITRSTLLAEFKQHDEQIREANSSKWESLPAPHFDEAIIWAPIYQGGERAMQLDNKAKIITVVENCKRMGFTTIFTLAKVGTAVYPSKFCKDIKEWVTEEFDPLGVMVSEARKRGMKMGLIMCPYTGGPIDWFDYPPNLTKEEAEKIKKGEMKIADVDRASAWARQNCPDHPKVRERALKITKELIERYSPDLMYLDVERYKDGYDTSCFCDYSIEKKAEFAKKHPELSPQEIIKKFSEESLVSFVDEWVKLCKRLDPKIKTCAYTISSPTSKAPRWVNKFPLDYHSKYVSRYPSGPESTLEELASLTKEYSKWLKEDHDCLLSPILSSYEYKTPERIYAEFKVLSHTQDQLSVKEKIVEYYTYAGLMLKPYDYTIDEGLAKAISKALGGGWK